MRRLPMLFPFVLLTACGTDPSSPDKPTTYAEARFLSLLREPQQYEGVLSTAGEPNIGFAFPFSTVGPVQRTTEIKQQLVGEWTGFLVKAKETAASGKTTVAEGERWTAVIASSGVPGAEDKPVLVWTKETGTPGTQAKVRFVFGVGGVSDWSVKVGASPVAGPFNPGVMSDWQEQPTGRVTVDIASKFSAPIHFAGQVVKAGELWTYAVVWGYRGTLELLTWREGESSPEAQLPTPP